MIALLALAAAASAFAASPPAQPPRAALPALPKETVRSLLADAAVTGGVPQSEVARLEWRGPVRLQIEADALETVVRFDRPLTDAAVADFRRRAGAGLGLMEWNDSSLVLRPSKGRIMKVATAGNALSITILPVSIADSAPDVGGEDGVNYLLAAAASDRAAGYPGRARARLAALERAHPDDPRVVRALADDDRARGANRRAAERYRTLKASDEAALEALRDASGEASLGAIHRGGADFSQTESAARIIRPVQRDLAIGAAARIVRTRADAVVVPGGIVRDARDRSVIVEGSVSPTLSPTLRIDLLAAAELTDTRAGVGGRFVFGPGERELRLIFGYHLPDLATAEQALLGGRIDRFGVGGSFRLSADASVQLDMAANAYSLAGEGRRATSISISGGVDYTLKRREPSLSLIYRLDAEYIDRLDLRVGGAAVLPLVDRENHTLQALAGIGIGRVRLAGAAGWTVDRYGSDGPTATITANAALARGWRVETAGGITSISRPDLPGTQVFARASITRSLGWP